MKKDNFYMELAEKFASQSKDPNTKVGACIVKDGRVLSSGWNGAPRNFPDNEIPWSNDTTLPIEKQKYPYMVHAEMNAVLNFGGSLRDFKDAVVYVTVFPCADCAKMLSQLEISEVVYKEEYRKQEVCNMAKLMFNKCGIKYRKIEE